MARIKGSGEQNILTIGVRANPQTIAAFKTLAEIKGTSYSREIREALQEHLRAYREILEEANKRVKRDVTVAADLGTLNRHIKAVVPDKWDIKVENDG